MKILLRAIRPSLDGDINQKVGLILLAHNLARTVSPLIGGYFADKYQKFKLIATIGYIAGKKLPWWFNFENSIRMTHVAQSLDW